MTQILSLPHLARCDNRRMLAKVNPLVGGPEQWLTQSFLASRGYAGVTFDFFIDWSTNRCQNDIWIKRLSSAGIPELAESGAASLTAEAMRIGDDLNALHAFARAYGLSPHYQIFRDAINWGTAPESILKASVGTDGFSSLTMQSLPQLMESIRTLSGGPVNIGSKGLIYSTSTLECYLSHTNALWPGDVDCILWNSVRGCADAILEFKKHTLDTPVRAQQLSNYYPSPDERKYRRLALLRDRLDSRIPFFVVYYPTNPMHIDVKLERVSGHASALQSSWSSVISYKGLSASELGPVLLDAVLGAI